MNHIIFISVLLIVTAIILSGCASVIYSTKNLPKDYLSLIVPKIQKATFDPVDTSIGNIYKEEFQQKKGLSGAILVKNGTYALLHRVALVRLAKHSIELQTYIYENDITSRLLMHEMKVAADRGVRVRILVDDNGLDSDHSDIMILNYHPNIEVKVFNPFKYRSKALKYPQLILHVSRLNYRMHNKLFIVDDTAVIIGGRNVAGNYFDSNSLMNFSDTDVLFIGRISSEAVSSFDAYWAYHRSIPVSVFPEQDNPEELRRLDFEIMKTLTDNPDEFARYEKIMNEFIFHFTNKSFPIFWGEGSIIADPPTKADGTEEISPIMQALEYLWTISRKSIQVAAAYFVPGKLGAEDLTLAVKNGVKVDILTNSLSSTDAAVVYAGWVKYRDKLLRNGVNIYEYRKSGEQKNGQLSSGASLHSKVIVFDDKITWVGSFNLDPRSAAINTEVIAAFYNEEFAKKMSESIEQDMAPDHSWRLTDKDGTTIWESVVDGQHISLDYSPDTTLGKRMLVILMGLIPESLI